MTGVRSLAELVGIDTAKLLTMTARTVSGKEARDLGLVTELAEDPLAAAHELARELAQPLPRRRSPRPSGSSTAPGRASPRRTFARERAEQLVLLLGANAKAAREAAFGARPPRASVPARRR